MWVVDKRGTLRDERLFVGRVIFGISNAICRKVHPSSGLSGWFPLIWRWKRDTFWWDGCVGGGMIVWGVSTRVEE